MNLVVFDDSKGICYNKTKKYLSGLLLNISDRKYVGNLPSRTIKEMLIEIRQMVSKNSDILILIADKEGFQGWIGFHFGKSSKKETYKEFLIASEFCSNPHFSFFVKKP